MNKRINDLIEQAGTGMRDYLTQEQLIGLAQALALASIAESLEKLINISEEFGGCIRGSECGNAVACVRD